MISQSKNQLTLYYDDTCILCTTNAIEMRLKDPDKIKIIPVDNAIEKLAKSGITRSEAMTYVCVKYIKNTSYQENCHIPPHKRR